MVTQAVCCVERGNQQHCHYHYQHQHQVVAKFYFICDIIMIGIIVSSSSSSIKFLAGLLYLLCMSWDGSLLVALSVPHMDWLWPKLVG